MQLGKGGAREGKEGPAAVNAMRALLASGAFLFKALLLVAPLGELN